MVEQEIGNLSVRSVIDMISNVVGTDVTQMITKTNTKDRDTIVDLASEFKSTILQNRDSLQQSRIDIQQTRIESQKTRLDLTAFQDDCSGQFKSLENKIKSLIQMNNERSDLLINDIRVICEDKIGQNRKRRLSDTEEELLRLTDPYYVPTTDDIYGSPNEDLEDEEEEENEDEHKVHELVEPGFKITPDKLPLYRLRRGTDSIKLIWDEYTKGINGGPLVRDLELKYQGRWKDDTERKYFSYRKKLYQIIEKVMSVDNKSEDEAILYLENVIQDPKGAKRSMTWLYDNIDEKYR